MKSSLEIAQQYFDLSNLAELDDIEKMIHPEATYSSDNTGLYFGKNKIMTMMRGFFTNHSKLHWQIKSIEQLDEHVTELHFCCHAIKNNGEKYRFSGLERIVVIDEFIRHIEVRV